MWSSTLLVQVLALAAFAPQRLDQSAEPGHVGNHSIDGVGPYVDVHGHAITSVLQAVSAENSLLPRFRADF